MWVLPNTTAVHAFLDAVHELFRRETRPRQRLGSLLVLGATTPNATPVLQGLFHPVVGGASFEHLPHDVLVEVLEMPDDEAGDLLIGGWTNPDGELLILVRGNLRTIVAPFSMFAATDHAIPDFRRLSFEDHGHTVRLGNYEASSDSILYELDPDYRRRLNAQRRESERGLGPALRRLRKQRGLSRSEFPGLSEKTIARIERGEIQRPNARTVKALEAKLGMALDEIAEF
ncbi:MAG TPA: helix-turn-helix domain-containing protein [Planctomycetota bacterium]|nr:helix-turn-helix domain-containing protein [Planctomycetota bacterium]